MSLKKMILKISFLNELVNIFRFFWKTPHKEKEIVFYAEHEGYYPNFSGLIENLAYTNKQKICYVTSDLNDPMLDTIGSKINVFYLKKLLIFFMVYVDCKVFVITVTDLNQFHLKRSINPVHYVYVFHSLISTHMGYLRGAFDHYDSILCVGPHHVKEIRSYEKQNCLPTKELIEAGYSRLESVYEEFQMFIKTVNSSSFNEKTILIAPSWGNGNVIETCGKQVVKILLDAGYRVIVRPHPETVKREPKLLSSLDSCFNKHEQFSIEFSVATNESMLKADLLICDASGIALEYAFGTERPVLFIDVPVKIRNLDYKDLGCSVLELESRSRVGRIIDPNNLDNLTHIVSMMLENQIQYKANIIQTRNKFVFNFGHASQIGSDHILNVKNRISKNR